MNINVSPDTEMELKKLAAQNGKDVAEYAGRVLEKHVEEHVVDEDPDALSRAVERLTKRTPEEVALASERILGLSKPPRPLPPGQTLFDVICGKWPGAETDEEVLKALEKLS